LRHEKILEFTSIWTEDIRGGKTALANTNKLVRFYSGCDGLKTGSTSVAKSCISATAKRDGMRLIAVVMAAENSDARNAAVRQMFDFGFATKELVSLSAPELDEIKVVGGVKSYVSVSCKGADLLCDKGTGAKMETVLEVAPFLNAPVNVGDVVGSLRGVIGDKEVLSCELIAAESVDRVGFSEVLLKILQKLFMG
jgi:D-alanyl-D-alanine carboxypeptidase (penicillin-binding protein 5/6)